MVLSFELESLGNGIPVMPPEAVGFYKQNCMVCFHSQGHESGVIMAVENEKTEECCEFLWKGDVTEELIKQYGDLPVATEWAAYAISFLLIRELTDYTACERSVKGTTIDYYLSDQSRDDDLLFNRTARLEVSGILAEKNNNSVINRINQKKQRLKSDEDLPAFIIVVEFSIPWSLIVTS